MFVEVILPLPIEGTFTYSVNQKTESKILPGHRVVVEFGSRKLYTGIVESVHYIRSDDDYSIKPIILILDKNPIVTNTQLELWKFVSKYYCCNLGEVYRNIIPSALKLESETFIRIRNNKSFDLSVLDENEILILQSALNKTSLSIKELELIVPKKQLFVSLKFLYDEKFIEINEKIIPKYKRKLIPYIKLNDDLDKNQNNLKKVIEELEKTKKQRELLLQFINLRNHESKTISKKELLKLSNSSFSVLRELEKKNILISYYLFVDRISIQENFICNISQLTEEQERANKQINNYFINNKNVLLYGVPSSGKTEIYLNQIQKFINEKKQVLLLVPDFSFFSPIIIRIQNLFGNRLGVYHSKLSTNERVEIWINCLKKKYNIIVGTRSAIFLPLDDLSLIIIDNEHDRLYKQNDNLPFYNCRDVARYLSKIKKIPCLLGSATPSLETYYEAKNGKIGLVVLKTRFNNIKLPEIEIISMKNYLNQQNVFGDISFQLKNEIKKSLKDNSQVLIFINRRGFSSILECATCGFFPICSNCDIALTYHKYSCDLKCHYCGYKENKINKCKVCSSLDVKTKGIGIQQIEEQLRLLFSTYCIDRMDTDTMRKKNAYENLLNRMNLKEIDILAGTQIISKGLDFDHVNLVGVIRADSLLHFPDFRASEWAMQLLIQLAGRSGRQKKRGKMLIQTFYKNIQFYQKIKNYDLEFLYDDMLKERQYFSYPPFTRLIEITVKDKDQEKVRSTSMFLRKNFLVSIPSICLLGPVEPERNKINKWYLNKILIKIPPIFSLIKIKKFICDIINELRIFQKTKSVVFVINVDPN